MIVRCNCTEMEIPPLPYQEVFIMSIIHWFYYGLRDSFRKSSNIIYPATHNKLASLASPFPLVFFPASIIRIQDISTTLHFCNAHYLQSSF